MKTRRNTQISLFLNTSTDFAIEDAGGKIYTIAEAKALWDEGRLADGNQGFSRLVLQFDWDLDAIKAYYKMMDTAR